MSIVKLVSPLWAVVVALVWFDRGHLSAATPAAVVIDDVDLGEDEEGDLLHPQDLVADAWLRFGQGSHVIEVSHFLSDAEVDRLYALARHMQSVRAKAHPDGPRSSDLWWVAGSSGIAYEDFVKRRRTYDPDQLMELGRRWSYASMDEEPASEDAMLLRAIEERIAEYSMIPPHDGEVPLMVGYRRAEPEASGRGRGGRAGGRLRLRNVHHDLNGAPRRAVTALIYLTDVEQGGHTIFPCLPAPAAGGSSNTSRTQDGGVDREFCAELVRGFKDGHRNLEPRGHPKCFSERAYTMAEKLCAGAAPGLRVRPRRGKAVFFTSALRDGSPDMLTWHAGCPVLRGEKITVQKFKEFPRDVRPGVDATSAAGLVGGRHGASADAIAASEAHPSALAAAQQAAWRAQEL